MKFLGVATILTILGLSLAAPSHHDQHGHYDHHDHHDQHHATSYAHVTKHDSHHEHDWNKHHSHDIAVAHDYGHHGDGYKHDNDGHHEHHHEHHDGHDAHDFHDKHAKYEFDYGVKDLKTGDIKNQWEHRDGGHVKGSYSLKESDGTTRIVEYSADDHKGFNAVVKKIGHAEHPVVYVKSHHHGDWEGDSAHKSYVGDDHHHGHDYGHAHATSYIKVKQH